MATVACTCKDAHICMYGPCHHYSHWAVTVYRKPSGAPGLRWHGVRIRPAGREQRDSSWIKSLDEIIQKHQPVCTRARPHTRTHAPFTIYTNVKWPDNSPPVFDSSSLKEIDVRAWLIYYLISGYDGCLGFSTFHPGWCLLHTTWMFVVSSNTYKYHLLSGGEFSLKL